MESLDGASGAAPPKSIIFFVDDDAVRHSMQVLLEAEGYRAKVFGTVASFMNGLAVAETPPHCVIADVELPDGDGCDVATHVAKQWPALPVILISGINIEALREHAIAVGAFACFAKPLELSALFDAIMRAVAL